MSKICRFGFLLGAAACIAVAARAAPATPAAAKPNLLVVTVDDMSCDSVGVYGCKLKGTTPNMDRLAAQSLRFNHAFVQVGNCMPSRNVMFSGRYPHNSGVEGFYQVKNPGYQVLIDFLKAGGYFNAIRGKVHHSTPYGPYPAWHLILDKLPNGKSADSKNPALYHTSTAQGIAAAKKAGKPFFLNINISDPHKPFYNDDKLKGVPDRNVPSRVFTAAEVQVPGFLPDDPEVRRELALYYSSVRRADDSLGQVLRALEESGEAERTVVMFLSDHGMPLPWAKTQLYYHSTRTPWMVRWPGATKPGAVDDRHLISAVDLVPTVLDIVGLPQPEGLDGRSFATVLRGETQAGRDYVVGEYNENNGNQRHPMRSIVTKDFAYLFNPWSNGSRVMSTATKGTISYRRMQALAKTDAQAEARLKLFDHRVLEELYNYAADPDALTNLIDDPKHRAERERFTRTMEEWMVKTRDPMLPIFRQRYDLKVREAWMVEMEKEAASHRSLRVRDSDGPADSDEPKEPKKKKGKAAVLPN